MMAVSGVTLERVARQVGGELEGGGEIEVSGIAELHLAGPGELSFVVNEGHLEAAKNTKAAAVLIGDSVSAVSLPKV